MPWKDPAKRRIHRRRKYREMKSLGLRRDWGFVPAWCPVCSRQRLLSKNSHGITKVPRDKQGRIIKRCKSCSKTKVYAKSRDRKYIVDRASRLRREQKVRAIKYLGSRCKDCGLRYDGRNAYAFDFHHRDQSKKEFYPASKPMPWEKVLVELAKCDLLCAICHRGRHNEPY